jgi:uncharacterized protein (DUF2141 family)
MKFKPIFYSPIYYSLMFILVFSGIGLASETLGTTKLTIHIEGFENSKGAARVALINSKENYGQKIPYKGFTTQITKNIAILIIPNLPRGEYAVKVFHDENENEKLDTRIFGIPSESYGFSNGAMGTMGPPDYEKAVFLLDTSEKRIDIQIK